MKLEAKYEFIFINPFVPVGTKGQPPTYALLPGKQLHEMRRALKGNMPAMPANGGWVICHIVDADKDSAVMGKGTAICSLSDKFDAKTGKELALARARENALNSIKYVGKKFEAQLAGL